jgi:hypothetical protein
MNLRATNNYTDRHTRKQFQDLAGREALSDSLGGFFWKRIQSMSKDMNTCVRGSHAVEMKNTATHLGEQIQHALDRRHAAYPLVEGEQPRLARAAKVVGARGDYGVTGKGK